MAESRHPTHPVAIGIALFVTVLWSSSWVLVRWGVSTAKGYLPSPLLLSGMQWLRCSLLAGFSLGSERLPIRGRWGKERSLV